MDLSIRAPRADADLEGCARLMATSEPWVTLGRSYAASLAIIREPGKEVYVAYADDGLAGFLIIDMHGAFRGYIQTVCVAPACRGQGIGSRLVEWAEARIFRDSPNVFMCVSSFNEGAFRLYQRLGYEVVGELRDYLVRGHAEILLRKTRGTWGEFMSRDGT
jgi:ribosomal protein S18 acetylase RimI-like enzyme